MAAIKSWASLVWGSCWWRGKRDQLMLEAAGIQPAGVSRHPLSFHGSQQCAYDENPLSKLALDFELQLHPAHSSSSSDGSSLLASLFSLPPTYRIEAGVRSLALAWTSFSCLWAWHLILPGYFDSVFDLWWRHILRRCGSMLWMQSRIRGHLVLPCRLNIFSGQEIHER